MRWLTSLLAFGLVWSSVSLPDANAINPPGPVGGIGHGRYWHRNPAGAAGGWGRGWNYNPPGPGRVSYVNYRPHVNPPVWRAEPVTVHIGPTTNPVRPAAPAAAGHGIHQVKDSGTTPATRCIARNV